MGESWRVRRNTHRDAAKDVGRKLGELRRSAGLRQTDVAASVGMTPQQLCKIEHGSNEPLVSTVLAVLAVLGKRLADLDDDKSPAESSV